MNRKNKLPKLILISAAFTIAPLFWATVAHAESPLEGAWMPTSWTSAEGERHDDPLPGLLIFTSTHYSAMFELGDKPRPTWEGEDGEATDAYKAAAYENLYANSGSYEIEGNRVIYRVHVARAPGMMYKRDWKNDPGTYEFERHGDKLVIKYSNGITGTYRRVEGQPYSR